MNKDILSQMGYSKEVSLIESLRCPFCTKAIGNFRDELSLKEYKISGLCQECQDETFGKELW